MEYNGGPFYDSVIKRAAADFPETARDLDLRQRLSPLLVSPEVVELPRKLLDEARKVVSAFWELRNLPSWQDRLSTLAPAIQDPGNSSVLMSYDFHIDSEGHLRLIEINTNASMALIADLLYRTHGLKNGVTEDFRETIITSFREDFALAVPKRKAKAIAIADDRPEQQRMFAEFKLYQELFRQNGFECEIANTQDFSFDGKTLRLREMEVDIVYNRDVDFYFTKPSSRAMAEASLAHRACVTPHAFEYLLLADKERLIELSRDGALAGMNLSGEARTAIETALIRSADVAVFDANALWNDRKRWFFKPKRLHGGKAVYRGSSISRGTFKDVLAGDYVAQEMIPPPHFKNSDGVDFKYDLRFFVYRDKIQLACARLYQGQMTNSQTPGGGIAPISWMLT